MSSTTNKINIGGVKKSRNQGLKAVTGNRVTDGVVVYFTTGNSWSDRLSKASFFEGDEALATLERASVQESQVVGPYLMDIELDQFNIAPSGRAALREQIRQLGPTVPADYSTQTGG